MGGKMIPFDQGTDPDWSHLYQLIGSINGYSKWSRIWSLTSLNDDTNFELTVRNLGTSGGGRHFQALHSATGAAVVQITDAGIALTGTISGLAPGIMAPWAGTGSPAKWLPCNGAAVSRTTYALLFAAIGVTWGAGDGSTTFNVPDLRGRVALGTSGSFALAATGGATTYDISHTHTGPSHTHTIADHSHGPGNLSNTSHGHAAGSLAFSASSTTAANNDSVNRQATGNSTASDGHTHTFSISGSVTNSTANASANIDAGQTSDKTGMVTAAGGTGNTGSGGSATQSTMPPYAVATWIIYAAA